MRPEVLYLTDMVEAADAIHRFLVDVPREEFLEDEFGISVAEDTL